MSFIGFEISPSSTHMSVNGVKKKTQKAINQEVADKWAKESNKRNKYFATFGITTITFTDNDLRNIDKCFNEVARFLSERASPSESLAHQLSVLDKLKI
jgi:hypothetical protein